MPDYAFYQEMYAGTAISQGQFPELMARSRDYLEKLERCCTVQLYGPDSRKMALCAIAEELLRWRKMCQYSQVSIGGVSVRCEKSDLPLQRRLLAAASGYLDICRGVG